MSLNILIVEGNNPKDSEVFIKAAKATCAQNLKNLVLEFHFLSPNNFANSNLAILLL